MNATAGSGPQEEKHMEIESSKAKLDYIFGVEPDAPVVENENGGKQSDTPYGFHLLPCSASGSRIVGRMPV